MRITKLPTRSNVKTNRMGVQTGIVTENGILPVNTLIFFKKCCCSLRNFYKQLICCAKCQNMHIHTFRKCWSLNRVRSDIRIDISISIRPITTKLGK